MAMFSYNQKLRGGRVQTIRAPNEQQLKAAVLAFRRQSNLPMANAAAVDRDVDRHGQKGNRARNIRQRRRIGIKDLIGAGKAAVDIIKGNVASKAEMDRRKEICMSCDRRVMADCRGYG